MTPAPPQFALQATVRSPDGYEWVEDRNNRRREYRYTVEGTLATEKWYDWDLIGLDWDLVETLSYTYQNGLLVSATNSSGSYELTYDDFGRVIHSAQTIGATEIWLTFGYDQYGYRNLVIDSFGGREESLYDPYGNLLRRTLVQEGNTLRIDQAYDSADRLLSQSRYSDVGGTALVATTEYAYEWNNRVSSIVHKNATPEVIAQFEYEWDLSGELVGKIEMQSELNSGDPTTFTFGYDDQGQLTDDGDNEYSYDENGNRTMSGYVTGDDNRILSDGTWAYDYDDEGNITGKEKFDETERWVYGYDHHNHLVLAQKFDEEDDLVLEAEYRYDPLGNRIEKAVDWDGEGTLDAVLTQFAIDGWNNTKSSPIGNENYDVWADLGTAGSLTTRYLRGDRVDELIARLDNVDGTLTPYWLLTDRLGSVRDVLDSNGSLVDSVSYDAFGNTLLTETHPTMRGHYGWTGREWDVETQLQYNRARYFDPMIGRWISQDPMGFEAGDSNLFRYASNRPDVFVDPSGLDSAAASAIAENYIQQKNALAALNAFKGTVIGDWPNWYYSIRGKEFTFQIRVSGFTPDQAVKLAHANLEAHEIISRANNLVTNDDAWKKAGDFFANTELGDAKMLLKNRDYFRGLLGKTVKGLGEGGSVTAHYSKVSFIPIGLTSGTKAYAKKGSNIYIMPGFWSLSPSMQANTISHEYARVYLFDDLPTEGNSLDKGSVTNWDVIMDLIYNNYDKIMSN